MCINNEFSNTLHQKIITRKYCFLSLKGVAIMQFQNPPVNSLSLDFLTEFAINVEKLELDRSCKGMIITSVSNQKHLL